MKTSEPTNCKPTKLLKEREAPLITEMKKLVSLSAACEYYLAALCERTDINISFEKFSPKELSKWSREWASHERFKKKGMLQQILYSGFGVIFKANDPVIENLSYCYIDVAQKLMFYSGEFESSGDYLRAFTDCCRDEIEGSINIEEHCWLRTRDHSQLEAEAHKITLSIDEWFFVVKVKKSSDEKNALIYSVQSRVPDESDQQSVPHRLTMSYLKEIIGLFACALWIDMTGEQASDFIEVSTSKFTRKYVEIPNSKVAG